MKKPLFARQPEPGWALSRPNRTGPGALASSVTSFGETACKFGSGAARRPITAIVCSAVHPELQGQIAPTNIIDMFGAPTATVPSSRPWAGKVSELSNWAERPGFGLPPSYLQRELPKSGNRSPRFLSEETMRLTIHPTQWASHRRQAVHARRTASPRGQLSCSTFGVAPAFLSPPPSREGQRSSPRPESPRWCPPSPRPYERAQLGIPETLHFTPRAMHP